MALAAHYTSEALATACLQMFRQGHDTYDLGKHFGISEAKASKLVQVARDRERGLSTAVLARVSR